jgi:hypothetical protein
MFVEDQEKLIFDKMEPLEKVGVNMLKKVGAKPQTKQEIGEKLKVACAGKLSCQSVRSYC